MYTPLVGVYSGSMVKQQLFPRSDVGLYAVRSKGHHGIPHSVRARCLQPYAYEYLVEYTTLVNIKENTNPSYAGIDNRLSFRINTAVRLCWRKHVRVSPFAGLPER